MRFKVVLGLSLAMCLFGSMKSKAALWMAADENVIYTENDGVNEVSAWWTFGNAGSGGSARVCSGGPLLPVYDAASPRIIQGSSANNLQEAGRRNLFVSGDGNAATTVTFPAAGQYTLTLRACRTRFGVSDYSSASELSVTVDGCVTQTVSTYRDVFQDLTVGPFTAPGDQPLTLSLQGTGPPESA